MAEAASLQAEAASLKRKRKAEVVGGATAPEEGCSSGSVVKRACCWLTLYLLSSLFPCMRARVLGQAAGLGERLAARLADIRLLTRMRAHV